MTVIYKEALIESLQQLPCGECQAHGDKECHTCFMGKVLDAPAADGQEPVQECRGCLYWEQDILSGMAAGVCGLTELMTEADGFCHMAAGSDELTPCRECEHWKEKDIIDGCAVGYCGLLKMLSRQDYCCQCGSGRHHDADH